MTEEISLTNILRNMCPKLQEETYVFCQVSDARLEEVLTQSLCIFREGEGMSAILPKCLAQQYGIASSGPFRQITLQVFSGLSAVGLTATVTRELADAGIVANMVNALRHDHVFVPEESAQQALQLLRGLSNRVYYT
ncbi:ACT domain-containing protein [Microbulbifer sp. THAF38]|uniref:ACT domain-containing protein n=1 Tax=Microbulbifer sp. THAF38 TaxID=2587856 RepID=UPI001268A02F|nr:ACT domain-containing protein [Microbulbifer sp. THAF38]QFT53031.1 ACT domain protein [Microbulbifer sp. THAF38]